MFRSFYFAVITAVVFVGGPVAFGQGEPSADDKATVFASRVVTLINVVLEKHIDPPARQQMLLTGVKALYHAAKQPAPKGLSSRVSDLSGTNQIEEYLYEVHQEFAQVPNAEQVLTRGMLQTVPGGTFLVDAESAKVGEQLGANRYVGTGIALAMDKEQQRPQMVKVFYNGPAWLAGARNGDVIFEIDGESTESKDLRRIVEELRGEEGSDVKVILRQPDTEDSRDLTITRGRVFIPSVEGFREHEEGRWKFIVDSADDIALFRFKRIGPSTLHELRQAATKLRAEKIRGIVLDLRESGGLLHDTVMVADSLLDGGMIGRIRTLDSVTKHEAQPGELFDGLPIAVLIGRQMSPGSIYLTTALRDNKRAVVVGEPTAIIPYVSELISIPGRNDRIRMATGLMMRGDGTPLQAPPARTPGVPPRNVLNATEQMRRPGFLVPDHVVANSADPAGVEPTVVDATLVKAIEVLREAANQARATSATEKVSG